MVLRLQLVNQTSHLPSNQAFPGDISGPVVQISAVLAKSILGLMMFLVMGVDPAVYIVHFSDYLKKLLLLCDHAQPYVRYGGKRARDKSPAHPLFLHYIL